MCTMSWRASVCLVLLLSVTYTSFKLANAEEAHKSAPEVVCPLTYERHSVEDINSGAVRPYLFGGIYRNDRRPCINCQRGGLWSSFCGFSKSGKAPFWDNQLCNASTVDAVINRTLQFNDGAELLQMQPCDMWYYLRGRTTWIIGDSMSKDLFKALKCFMVEFSDLSTYHASNNYTAMHLLDSLPGYGEPHCVHMPQHTRLCQVHAIQGDLFIEGNRTDIGIIPLLHQSLASPQDIFIMNFGLWHGETKQPEYIQNLHQLGKFYNATKAKFPNLFWMETPKQHFDSADGDYKVDWIGKRKGPFTCQAVKGLTLNSDGQLVAEEGNAVADYVMKGSWRNIVARDILGQQYKVPIVPVYNVTATAWEYHRVNFDGQECSHYCHPSMPQLWLWTLKQTFHKYWIRPVENPKVSRHRRPGCASVLERDEAKLGAPKPLELALQQQRQQQQPQQRRGFWDWLFGRRSLQPIIQVVDGVAVFASSSSSGSDSRGGGSSGDSSSGGGSSGDSSSSSYSHTSTLHPWQTLGKLLDKVQQEKVEQQQHRRQQQQQSQHDR